eukprot:g9612.t1
MPASQDNKRSSAHHTDQTIDGGGALKQDSKHRPLVWPPVRRMGLQTRLRRRRKKTSYDHYWNNLVGKSAEAILNEATKTKSGFFAAWVHLGKALRKEDRSVVARVCADPRCRLLADGLKAELSLLDPKQLANAWLGLRDLQYRDSALLNQLRVATIARSADFGSQALSNTLNALAQTRWFRPGHVLLGVLYESVSKRVDKFSPQGVANTLHAIVILNSREKQSLNYDLVQKLLAEAQLKSEASRQGSVQKLLAEAQLKSAFLKPSELGGILFSLSRIHQTLPAETVNSCIKTLCAAIYQRLEQDRETFQQVDIATIFDSLARIGYNPGLDFFQAICQVVLSKASTLRPPQMACILYGLSKFLHRPEPAVLEALATQVSKQVRGYTGHLVTTCLISFGRLHFLRPYSMSASGTGGSDATASEHAEHEKHLAGKRHQEQEMAKRRKLLAELCARATEVVDTLPAPAVANTLEALVKLKYNPGPLLLAGLANQAGKKGNEFDQRHIANVFTAFVKLSWRPEDWVLAVLCERSMKIDKEMGPEKLLTILHCLAQLGYNPGQAHAQEFSQNGTPNPGDLLVANLSREAVRYAQMLSVNDIAILLHSLAS